MSESLSVMFDCLWHHGLYSPWNSPSQNTRVGSHSLLQGIFPTQGSNPGLLDSRGILYHLGHQRRPRILEWVAYPFFKRSSHSRNQTGVSCIAGRFSTSWAIRGVLLSYNFTTVWSLSHVRCFATSWTTERQASLSITNSQSLPKLMSNESVMPSNHLILCRPLLLLPPIFPNIRVFSNESVLPIRCPKYWSFSFNITPSNEHPGLISFRMDWLDLLAVQGILKSLLQHHSSKASILQCSVFFIVQLSHSDMARP